MTFLDGFYFGAGIASAGLVVVAAVGCFIILVVCMMGFSRGPK